MKAQVLNLSFEAERPVSKALKDSLNFKTNFNNYLLLKQTADSIPSKLQHLGFDNEINRNLGSLKSYAGLGVKYEFNGLRPVIDPEFNENILSLEKYNFSYSYHGFPVQTSDPRIIFN